MASSEQFFAGLTFKFDGIDEEDREYLSDWLSEAGGQLVSTDFQGEVDYLVTPCTGGSSGHLFKKHVSSIWLEDCLDRGELLNVAYFHKIIHIHKDLKPLEGVVTGMSGYGGREKQFLNCVVESLGGVTQEIFAKRENKEKGIRGSTHLIYPGVDKMVHKEKYKAALKWQIPVISADWLRACLKEQKWVSESSFLVGDSAMFTPKIGDENKKAESDSINREQEEVIKKLEGVLNFLRTNQIKNEECFVNTKKSVDDVLASLKFLPIEPSFNTLPMEIKTRIIGYLCDSGASLVMSEVCGEWREIIMRRAVLIASDDGGTSEIFGRDMGLYIQENNYYHQAGGDNYLFQTSKGVWYINEEGFGGFKLRNTSNTKSSVLPREDWEYYNVYNEDEDEWIKDTSLRIIDAREFNFCNEIVLSSTKNARKEFLGGFRRVPGDWFSGWPVFKNKEGNYLGVFNYSDWSVSTEKSDITNYNFISSNRVTSCPASVKAGAPLEFNAGDPNESDDLDDYKHWHYRYGSILQWEDDDTFKITCDVHK